MGKTQKFSKGHSLGSVPLYGHAVETVGESDFVGSPARIESQDSYAPKRKCTSLNNDRWVHRDGFNNIPRKVFSIAQMSAVERKQLEATFRQELEDIQALERRFFPKGTPGSNGVQLYSFSGLHMKDQVDQPSSKLKRNDSAQSLRRPPPSANPALPKTPSVNPALAKTDSVNPALAKTYSMVMKQCESLLKRLMTHNFSWVFNEPVDAVKLNLPDYFDIIKHPMDLGTISGRMRTYLNPRDFAADVRLTFSNAMTYNPRNNNVHMWADTLSKFFEQRWKPIEKKLLEAERSFRDFRAEESIDLPTSKPRPDPKNEVRPVMQPKKRKPSPPPHDILQPHSVKRAMTEDQKHILTQRLQNCAVDLPQAIIDFLRAHTQVEEDEIVLEIDSLGDETLFQLEKLLDDCSMEKPQQNHQILEEVDIVNLSGLSHSSMHHEQGNDAVEEDVDICDNDPPVSTFVPLVIEKDVPDANNKPSSSSSSSSDSGSSSSDSDSSSSGSDSEAKVVHSPSQGAKEVQSGINMDGTRDGPRHVEESIGPVAVEDDSPKEGENAPSEKQLSPEKQHRAALLKDRFLETILKAREKTIDQVAKSDPEKGRREREELERIQREERARLQAEAKAAEEARKKAQAAAALEAAAEAKRQRELEREAARKALQQMEKTVDINEGTLFFKDLEMLTTVPGEHLPSSVGETSPDSPDGLGSFRPGSNPLEQLGLYMKVDDDDEEGEPTGDAANDVEEGEID